MDKTSASILGIETVLADQGIGSPVLFIHGWGGSHSFWRYLWPAAVPKFHCIAPDLPGWGESDKPEVAYTIDWYADWIASLLHVKADGPAAIVAHSMGATIAIELALRHPTKVSALVLAAPLVRGADGLTSGTRALTLPIVRNVIYPFTKWKWVLRRITNSWQLRRPLEETDLAGVSRGTYASMIRPVDSLKQVDLVARLGEIRVPTLVVGCTNDMVVPVAQAQLAATIPGSRYEELHGCGHLAMLEDPAAFNPLVLQFLSSRLLTATAMRPRQW